MTPEFSRTIRAHDVGTTPRHESIEAKPVERAGIAARFDLRALDRLTAELTVVRDAGGIRVTGRFAAAGEQACVVSAEPVAFALDEAVDLRFSEAVAEGDEIELGGSDLDIVPLDGDHLDLGEAVAQSLGLALDPYPRAPTEVRAAAERLLISEAEAARIAAADKVRANPFAMLRPAK
jgi:uncharacterized metal-binding protein YceD (DUF177 family)